MPGWGRLVPVWVIRRHPYPASKKNCCAGLGQACVSVGHPPSHITRQRKKCFAKMGQACASVGHTPSPIALPAKNCFARLGQACANIAHPQSCITRQRKNYFYPDEEKRLPTRPPAARPRHRSPRPFSPPCSPPPFPSPCLAMLPSVALGHLPPPSPTNPRSPR